MPRGPVRRAIPLLVAGAIDTKLNPKLVRPGSLLTLENMYQQSTGLLTPRNGFTKVSATRNITTGDNLFVSNGGGLATIARGWLGTLNYPVALRYGTAAVGISGTGWETNQAAAISAHPMMTALVTGMPAPARGTIQPDVVDPDACTTAGLRIGIWTDPTGGSVYTDSRDAASGRTGAIVTTPALAAGRFPKIAATGGNWSAIFCTTGNTIAAAPMTSGFTGATFTIGVDLDAAAPWFDVKAIPGTNNFAVAYKVTAAGGVKCGIYNPSAATFTSVVTTAGADASMTLGWLDDSFTTGSMFLATAGAGPGVVVRTMSATTMAVSATNVIDATATANVRNITGHLNTATPAYTVLWDLTSGTAINDSVQRGKWTGAASVQTIAQNHSLYSRSVRMSDGTYYVLGCFASSVQGTYAMLGIDTAANALPNPQCHVLSGEGGPRRQQNNLASPFTVGSTVTIAAVRARKIATPTGAAASQTKTYSFLGLSVMSKITHARELGGTVFFPGGLVQQDDGAIFGPATFPIYPEVPTGTSAVGGAMTAAGAYSYRTVFRSVDASGRPQRSAASVPFAITLGGADGTVNLTLFNLNCPRGDSRTSLTAEGYGAVWQEIYRRGPAASGASLYNKVGEVLMGSGTATVAFADTMSDANAALGEAAYFNGNVLENFHPPATSLLEVNGNRVGLVNAEDPTEFWFSKEYKAGAGVGFNPTFKVSVSGDGAGGLTALAAMDGRWILFKKTAIYVMSGDGPNDLGQGSFNAPQAVSRTIGTSNPSSLLETPDGIMFQSSAGGMWLLDRGLGLTYIGAPVEVYTLAANVVGAALVSNLPFARFVTSTGRMVEWDYYHKKWYTHQLRTDAHSVVDCANSSLFGWCYLLDNGVLMKEQAGSNTDVNGTSTQVIPTISFPHIQLAGLAGYQRFHSIEFTLDVLGNHTFSVDAEYDFSGVLTGTPKTIALVAATTPTAQVEYNPPDGLSKCTAVRPVITLGNLPLGACFALTGATAIVSVKRGVGVPDSRRML